MKNFLNNLFNSEPFVFLKGALIFLIGPINSQLAYLGIVIAFDLILGIRVAIKKKLFRWSILLRKLRTKIMIYSLWISIFHAFDIVADMSGSARWSVILALMGLEALSALKNTAKLGHKEIAEALGNAYLSLVSATTSAIVEEVEEKIEEMIDGKKGGSV